MLCEVAEDRPQAEDLGDGPAPERKPRARLCPRCGRGPLTGSKCGWCRGTGSRQQTGDLPDNAKRGA